MAEFPSKFQYFILTEQIIDFQRKLLNRRYVSVAVCFHGKDADKFVTRQTLPTRNTYFLLEQKTDNVYLRKDITNTTTITTLRIYMYINKIVECF